MPDHAGCGGITARRGVCDGLPAADRVKYDLVRRGRLDELLELLAGPPRARRRLGRYHGEYPAERPRGSAAATASSWPDVQELQIAAVRREGRRAPRMRLAPARPATMPVRRLDLEPRLQWSGFRASITPEALLVEGGDGSSSRP